MTAPRLRFGLLYVLSLLIFSMGIELIPLLPVQLLLSVFEAQACYFDLRPRSSTTTRALGHMTYSHRPVWILEL